MPEFERKVAIVTGAGAGIGETIVETLVECGARVLAASRTGESVAALAGRLDPDGARVIPFEADVRDPRSVEAMVAHDGRLLSDRWRIHRTMTRGCLASA